MKVTVIVPAYNEASNITKVVIALKSIAPSSISPACSLQVLVVDDGSSDQTSELAKQAGADKIVRHKVNLGLGAAVRTGLVAARESGSAFVVKFDADLQHDPDDVIRILTPLIEDEADIVFGNRFEKIEYRMPFVRKIGNITFTRLMRWLTGWPLRDSQPGIFAVNSSYLQRFYLPGDYNYTQQILLDAYHKGMRFAHVSVSFRKRISGSSFVSFKYPMRVLPQIIAVLVGVKPLKIFGSLGAFFLGIATVVFFYDFIRWTIGDSAKPVQQVNLVLGFGLFGLQTLFFGLIADLIVKINRK